MYVYYYAMYSEAAGNLWGSALYATLSRPAAPAKVCSQYEIAAIHRHNPNPLTLNDLFIKGITHSLYKDLCTSFIVLCLLTFNHIKNKPPHIDIKNMRIKKDKKLLFLYLHASQVCSQKDYGRYFKNSGA